MGKAEPVDLLCFIGSSDAELLPHFLRHYRQMGIATFRFLVHGAWSDEQLARLVADDIVILGRVDERYEESVKERWINQAARELRGRWIVCVDADEFLMLPFRTLTRTVAVMRAMGLTDLPARLMQRLAADGGFPSISEADDLEAVFPLYDFRLAERLGVTDPVWKSKYPLSFVTDCFRAGRGHHLPRNGQTTAIHPLRGVVSHFKWRDTFRRTSRIARGPSSGENERGVYLAFLAEGRPMPLDGAKTFSREAMVDAGHLVAPPAEAVRALGASRRLRSGQPGSRDLARLDAVRPAWPQPFADAEGLLTKRHLLPVAPGRIALIGTEISGYGATGGIGTAMGSLAERLAAAGHDVHMFFCPWQGERSVYEPWLDYWSSRGVTIHNMPRRFPGGDYEQHVPFTRRLTAALSDGQFDIVNFHDSAGYSGMPLLLRAAGLALAGTQVVVTVHGPARWHKIGNYMPWGFEEGLQDHCEKIGIRLADAVVFPSQAMLDYALDHYPTDAAKILLPNCLVGETRRFLPPPDEAVRPERVVFFGRVELRKGIDTFLEAVELARARGVPRFEAVILGRYGQTYSSEQLAKRVARWPTPPTIISSYTNTDAVDYLRSESCVAVIPSRLENLPYTVYECVENGIPVICSPVGGIPELIASGAAYAVTADDFARKIEVALTRGLERPSLSFRPEQADMDALALHTALVAKARASRAAANSGVAVALDDPRLQRIVWDRPTAGGWLTPQSVAEPAAASDADYLLILRHGVTVDIEAASALLNTAMSARAEAVLCGCQWDGARGEDAEFPFAGPPEYCVSRNVFGWGVMLVRRTTFLNLGGFSPLPPVDSIAEWEFANRMLAAGRSVLSLPLALAVSRRTPALVPQNEFQQGVLASPWVEAGGAKLTGILRMALLPPPEPEWKAPPSRARLPPRRLRALLQRIKGSFGKRLG